MFKRLATLVPNGAQALAGLHPAELTVLLEQAWNARKNAGGLVGHPDRRSDVNGIVVPLPPIAVPPTLNPRQPQTPANAFLTALSKLLNPGIGWDHLIYAYMVENTRIYEIFRRVIHEFLHGEKLGAPGSPGTHLWLRSTEELFYRDPPPFSIVSVSSHVRPDLRATRRNAYQRLLGMELNHGNDDNSPFVYPRAEASNAEFVSTFEELLREVWVGYTNRTTTTANPTDDAKITDLAVKLNEMLVTRRQNGNLAREEFYFVAMMSWLHMTVDAANLDIIRDLRADGSGAEQRLFKIAQKVGLPAHGLSRSYFQIAEPVSTVLTLLETGAMSPPGAARAFYDPAVGGTLPATMNAINMHWSAITGRDVKAGKVATAA